MDIFFITTIISLILLLLGYVIGLKGEKNFHGKVQSKKSYYIIGLGTFLCFIPYTNIVVSLLYFIIGCIVYKNCNKDLKEDVMNTLLGEENEY